MSDKVHRHVTPTPRWDRQWLQQSSWLVVGAFVPLTGKALLDPTFDINVHVRLDQSAGGMDTFMPCIWSSMQCLEHHLS